jgi:hypothetical protein
MPSDLPPDHAPALVAQIMEIVLDSPFRTVHYTGGADESLLRALLADRERQEVTVMDVMNRWGSATRFFGDEFERSGMEFLEVPDWLEGVSFYQEGAPDHEIGLRDWPWDSHDQLSEIVGFAGRSPPKLLLLFGLADCSIVGVEGLSESGKWERKEILRSAPIHHPAYEWETLGDLRVGRWKESLMCAHVG